MDRLGAEPWKERTQLVKVTAPTNASVSRYQSLPPKSIMQFPLGNHISSGASDDWNPLGVRLLLDVMLCRP